MELSKHKTILGFEIFLGEESEYAIEDTPSLFTRFHYWLGGSLSVAWCWGGSGASRGKPLTARLAESAEVTLPNATQHRDYRGGPGVGPGDPAGGRGIGYNPYGIPWGGRPVAVPYLSRTGASATIQWGRGSEAN